MSYESDRCRIVGGDNQEEPKTHWRSIYVATALSFCGAVQFSLYFSALFPYMRKVSIIIELKSNFIFRLIRVFQKSSSDLP
jgi:ABC-type polysaccharide/polyol phosphate export permease